MINIRPAQNNRSRYVEDAEFCDYFFGGNSYGTEPMQMQRYYDGFVMMERLSERGRV